MTPYRRFKFAAGNPATVANFATAHEKPAQSVAILASVAGMASQTTSLEIAPDTWSEPQPLGDVPEPYLDAWARLQVQRPAAVSHDEWRAAVTDAGLFLDRWGSLALEFQWLLGDLFDVPGGGSLGGLIWFLNGEAVRALGPEHVITESGRVFDRATR